MYNIKRHSLNEEQKEKVRIYLKTHKQIEASRVFGVSKSYISIHFSKGRDHWKKNKQDKVDTDLFVGQVRPDTGIMTRYRCQNQQCKQIYESEMVYSQVRCPFCLKMIYED